MGRAGTDTAIEVNMHGILFKRLKLTVPNR
jgi:hypothetical protein